MSKSQNSYPPIGIAGAARAGKDTLCRGLRRMFSEFDIPSKRKSIAGDTIKSDFKELLNNSFNINSFTEDLEEKELIRPLMVEYGKIARIKTEGRYFIEKCDLDKDFVNIIPDIRYTEYSRDEVQWLKNEVGGLLIFVERKNIFDANDTERVNNKIIKPMADVRISWSNLNENIQNEREQIDSFASDIITNYYLPLTKRTISGS